VENGMAPTFHLALVVHAPVETRVHRLIARGMTEADARARIASQATDEQRRAVADVWLDNSGWPEEVQAAVDTLWAERLVPYEANVRLRRASRWQPRLGEADPSWPQQAARVRARIALAAGSRGLAVDHIGSTAVPGVPAVDVLDLQLAVRSLADADAIADALADAGFPQRADAEDDIPRATADQRLHQSADPGQPVDLHVRVAGSPGWRDALLLRDWLRSDAAERKEYVQLKRQLAAAHPDDRSAYAEAKQRWFAQALPRAGEWASRTYWTAPEPVEGA
jgi:dephospho-CoA kinase